MIPSLNVGGAPVSLDTSFEETPAAWNGLNVGGAPSGLDTTFEQVPEGWDGLNAGGCPAGLEVAEFEPQPAESKSDLGMTWFHCEPIVPSRAQLAYDVSTNDLVASHDVLTEQYLLKIKNAILQFRLLNGVFPGSDGSASTFKSDLQSTLRGIFPVCPVGPAKNDLVRMLTDTSIVRGKNNPIEGWAYKNLTGEFIVNFTGQSKLDPNVHYDQF